MKKILIAEDDRVSRKFLSRLLKQYGECDQVVDGTEAIEAYMLAIKDKKTYDLICLDIMMPELDGIKVLKTIRDLEIQSNVRDFNQAKIIMTTVLGEQHIIQSAFDFGCNAFASKPINLIKFKEQLKKIGFLPI
ncbi:MAG: two-component system, chemotaxis family, chemotaxis protein CheY [Eubacteriaceae bacterium]|jgi:two-component system chemotaxis response regulator CheY|nr:two-component system, chemotaxis family, chemotaxis protein CheY [Eubacteriaceae bacterium]MDK2935673.1 two-component system, chemotaxis family, chemotaxis protein CheY [Eubacteriaceae bacterium]MDN5306825.1 two-component system, chemotaxis family, chemotaxis protein CheY [Eubacteriaceae bacterium]